MVKQEWEGKCLFNSFSSQARGVAIFLKHNNPAKIVDQFCDNDGNILAISMIYEEKKILLEVLYGPNQDSPHFYSELAFKKIEDWKPDYSIFAGDYNLVLDPTIDAKNYQHVNNPQAAQALKNQIQNYNLKDIWRELHPDARIFTWQKYNENKQSRLDFFLISPSLLPFVQKAEIIPGFRSDHSGIELEIDFSRFTRGRGFWKFNSSLIKEPSYLELVKDTIKRVVAQYAIIDGDEKFYENASNEILQEFYLSSNPESLPHINLRINPQSFLDVLLMEIRRVTISFSAQKKRERIAVELFLVEAIESLEIKLAAEQDIDNFNRINTELQDKKMELEGIYSFQAQGAFIRARAKYKIEGEKPSRLFCSLEKHNGVQKHIPKLIVEENNVKKELSDQKLIEEEIFKYYRNLFAFKEVDNTTIEEFLTQERALSCPKLSETEKASMENILTTEELTKYLKKTKNNVSPGSSGFTNEFFKFFWLDLKVFITKAINFSYENRSLSVTQRLGIITLIPKGEKDKTFIKNWRPLTLLNSLYKLISGCLAERMKPFLNKIIHSDQKGFVSDRYIGEAVRATYDLMQWAKTNNRTGILLLIDFEKAYDSLSFSFIKKSLNFFNFGSYIINWVEILLQNFSAVVNHCGNISPKMDICTGARQGDPIASYLFIISIEILALRLRSDPNLKGFKINDMVHLLELYADDCTLFLEANDENLKVALDSLEMFFRISGLKISVSKTKAVWFGEGYKNTHKLCPDRILDWDNKFRLLGIDFVNSLEGMENNYNSKLDEIKKIFNCWIHRTLSIYGKIVVIKSLALSKLSHLALVLPDLSKNQIKEVEKLAFNFIWNNKPDKVSREHAKLVEKAGGLGMFDIKSFWQSLKFSWFRRAINTNAFWPCILAAEVENIVGYQLTISDILQFGPKYLEKIGKSFKNKFWKQIFCSVTPFMQGALFCYPEKIFIAPIWDNPNITRNNKAIKKSTYPILSQKVSTMSDFFHPESGVLLSRIEIERRFNFVLEEETYLEFQYIFRIARRILGLNDEYKIKNFLPSQPLLINIANLTKKGCSSYYRILRKKLNLSTTLSERENKWHIELNCVYGVAFWNKVYSLAASIKNDNKMKYLQFQINRNSLFTNYKVSKFKANVSPYCTFCIGAQGENNMHLELISHLFYECVLVKNIWQEIQNWLRTFNIEIPIDKKTIIFGIQDQKMSTIPNYILLCTKYFIWKVKFQTQHPTFSNFLKFLKNKLEDLKNACLYEDKDSKFAPWLVIYNSLLSE